MKKAGIVLAVILAAVLAALIYQDNRQKVERSTRLERYLEETKPISAEIKKLTEQRENLDEEYREKIQGKTVLVTAEYVGQDIQDTAADCSVDKYRRLLEWLKEIEEDVDIRTLESESIYREQLARTSGMYQEEKERKK